MVDSDKWRQIALDSILSLWRPGGNCARSSSKDNDGRYRPTATFQAIVAMGECGILQSAVKTKDGKPLSARDILVALVGSSDTWAGDRIDESSHSHSKATLFQPALVIGSLFHALRLLLDAGALPLNSPAKQTFSPEGKPADGDRKTLTTQLCRGFAEASRRLAELTHPKDAPDRAMSEAELSELREVSTYHLLHVAIALSEREKILKFAAGKGLVLDDGPPATRAMFGAFKQSLRDYFVRQVDRLMARRHLPFDPEYDPTSLAFAIRGLDELGEQVCGTPLFRAAVEAVAAGQHADGCWPDGVSVTYQDDGSTIQQPSVEVALCLGESVFDNDLLVLYDADRIEVLDQAFGALEKTANFLAVSHKTVGEFSGWVSDRTRRPGVFETWVTSYAARLFHLMSLAERARRRAAILDKYFPRNPAPPTADMTTNGNSGAGDTSRRLGKMIEPDDVLRPVNKLLTEVVTPLENERLRGAPICRPDKNGVSYIIYGPPGSGKTFMVEQLAETLGWPLLALSPGHFIRRGLEDIESTAAKIFTHLMNLDHTVVFFDECDELFRERSEQSSEGRNILSFATASMLPKLQELHNSRRVVFFLGTNFLSHVDIAIRRPGRFDASLLVDRPDEAARLDLIVEGWKNEQKELRNKVRDMPPRYRDWAADQAGRRTNGWMSKDVTAVGAALWGQYDRARNQNHNADLMHLRPDDENEKFQDIVRRAAATVDDYVDWCVQQGKAELKAAGYEEGDPKACNLEVARRERRENFWKVFDRWKKLPDFYQDYVQHSKTQGPAAAEEAGAFIENLKKRDDTPRQVELTT
ncbi:ATP-binding protein [Mycobacterium sp. 050134]|uniref:ATP-binding protein n=1 Tax=Mycobacterium sp. 050134 TaxID=3096111 RepID=UPI002ED88FF5